MANKKLVIFDWGGVLEGVGDDIPQFGEHFIDVARECGASVYLEDFKKQRDKFYAEEGPYPYFKDNSDKAATDYMRAILKYAGLDITEELISKCKMAYVKGTFAWIGNRQLVTYAHALKERGVKIGLLSNLVVLDKIKQDADVNRSKFDYVWLSCDMDACKPEADIYNKVMRDIEDEGYDILFIDDREENLVVPRQLGWETFLMRNNNAEAIEAIEKFLGSD